MFAFEEGDVDVQAYLRQCPLLRAGAGGAGGAALRVQGGRQPQQQGGEQRPTSVTAPRAGSRRLGGGSEGGRPWRPPELKCRRGGGAGLVPIPVFPVAMFFPDMVPVLRASYEAFDRVRGALLPPDVRTSSRL
jgi:hypothetical protein